MPIPARTLLACPLLLLAAAAPPARAAESFDSCSGTIATLPSTLSSQGTWCLHGDLATSIASGAAITVTTNNVVIDCNGFKLGGLSAGPTTAATGIFASGRANVTVRNCNLRGFSYGVQITGSGATVVNNRFEGNLDGAIAVNGTGSIIRNNVVLDTGDVTNAGTIAIDLVGSGEAIGNTVETVLAASQAVGIRGSGEVTLADNRLRDVATGTGSSAIFLGAAGSALVHGNDIVGVVPAGVSAAIDCQGNVHSAVRDNVVLGTTSAIVSCPNVLDNRVLP